MNLNDGYELNINLLKYEDSTRHIRGRLFSVKLVKESEHNVG